MTAQRALAFLLLGVLTNSAPVFAQTSTPGSGSTSAAVGSVGGGLGSVNVQGQTTATPLDPGVRFFDSRYDAITTTRSDVAGFNIETTRAMVIDQPGLDLWAINTHASRLLLFPPAATTPSATYTTLLQPIAVTMWGDEILVLGGGTHALAQHNRTTGQIVRILDLPNEPCDIVVDEHNDFAFVSCKAVDSVVKIDLMQWRIVDLIEIPGKRAARLYLDVRGGAVSTAPTENPPVDGALGPVLDIEVFIYATSEISGNNSIVRIVPGEGALIEDGENMALYPGGGLPDVDLVSIESLTGDVSDEGRDANTIQFAHGRNPVTGEYWALGIESNNKQPGNTNLQALRGSFADNRIAIFDDSTDVPLPIAPLPDRYVSLDVAGSGGTDPLGMPIPSSLSTPWDVEFNPENGWAWVTSSTGDVVGVLDANGVRVPGFDLQLPEGSIPRDLLHVPGTRWVLIHAWGTSKIYLADYTSLVPGDQQIILTFDLGLDPTPESVQQGRKIFYDAHRSADDRSTCNHCHPGGGADGEEWQLADLPLDAANVTVTLPLKSFADSAPFHWRGEQSLRGVSGAFTSLLGGSTDLDPAPGSELDQLAAFLESLETHANPNQSETRRVVDSMTRGVKPNGLVGSASRGQKIFRTKAAIGSLSCEACHKGPTGGTGDTLTEVPSSIPVRTAMEAIQLDTQLLLKDQELISVTSASGRFQVPKTSGAGVLHDGRERSLFEFIDTFPGLTDQDVSDVTSFVEQFDAGIGNASHHAIQLNQSGTARTVDEIRSVLLAQARSWIDLVAFGTSESPGGTQVRSSWLYFPALRQFVSDNPTLPAQSLAQFVTMARQDQADLVFLGLPPGTGRRFALDRDGDELFNGVEIILGTDPDHPDSDGDGGTDGHEQATGTDPLVPDIILALDLTAPNQTRAPRLNFANTRLAKFQLSLNEAARVDVRYQLQNGPILMRRGVVYGREHSLVLTHNSPSVLGFAPHQFSATATVTDLAGNSRVLTLPTFQADNLLRLAALPPVVVGDLSFGPLNRTATSMRGTVSLRLDLKESSFIKLPAPGLVVVGQLSKKLAGQQDWKISTDFQSALPSAFFNGPLSTSVYNEVSGPFLVGAPTDAQGMVSFGFDQLNLHFGDELRFHVIGVWQPGPNYDPAAPVFDGTLPNRWQMPVTAPENRAVIEAF